MKLDNRVRRLFASVIVCALLIIPVQTFAQADYSCDTYGSGEYQNNSCFEPGGGSGTPKSKLSSTGRNILLIGGIGLISTIGGSSLLYITLKRRKNDK